MNFLNFPAVKLALLFALGILLGYALNVPASGAFILSIFCTAFLIAAFILSRRNTVYFGVCAALTTLSTGMLSYSLSNEINHKGHYLEADLSQMQLWHLRINRIEKHTSYNKVYNAGILSLNEKPARGSVQLRIKQSDSIPLEIDDEILVWGKAQGFSRVLNPYQWDYSSYMKKRNIYHHIRTSAPHIYQLNSSSNTIQGRASSLRKNLSNKLEKTGIPERELSIVKAILLGQRDDITSESFNSYRKAGAIHILAISGLHVGILLLLLRFLFYPLNRFPWGRPLALMLSVALLWGYALIAGFGPSVIRAVAMFSFLAWSLFLNRITHGYNTLALSLLFLLMIVNPLLIFEVGFQMSYAAVVAILWIYPILWQLWKPRNLILKKIWQIVAVSLAAQLGVLPISLFYFHQFPGLFLISSLVVIPFLGLILGTGFVVIILSVINYLPKLFIEFYALILFYLNEFIGVVSSMEFFYLDHLPFGTIELVLTYFLIYSLITLIRKTNAQRLALAMSFFLSILLCGIFYSWDTRNTDRLLIGHQYGDPVMIEQKGTELTAFVGYGKNHPGLLRNYQLGARTRKLKERSLKNSYLINGKTLIRLDSSKTYLPKKEFNYLWLTYSPKINLDRYLAMYSPQYIIADGSSPPYLVNRWKESARSKNIPFHYTGVDGAFEFKR